MPAMPLWTLEGLRNADPLLGLALVMLLGVLVADALHRLTRLPRVMGMMLVGALASPFALRLIESAELDPWKPLLDLAIGVLVFELGSSHSAALAARKPMACRKLRARGAAGRSGGDRGSGCARARRCCLPRWPARSRCRRRLSSRWRWSTRRKPRGQVTERLLLAAALNSIVAMLAVKAWRVVAAAGLPSPGVEVADDGGERAVCDVRLVPRRCRVRVAAAPAEPRDAAARTPCRYCKSRLSSSPACWPRSGSCRR